MSKNPRPIITPPIQRIKLIHFLTRELVRQGIKRFHRITTHEGVENLPDEKCPMIFVSNHQNGLMDPMVVSGLLKPQLHWLTRADVFWNPIARMYIIACNAIPIYRQRDKLPDLKKRNEIIWDCCTKRLEKGAVLSLFPEGNHLSKKTIRNLKRGLSDLIGLAVNRSEKLMRLKVIPVGTDYEDYPGYKRRLSFRIGKEIEWRDLYDKQSKSIDYKKLTARVQKAMSKLAIDIRPADMYDDLYPYVRAMNTTKAKNEAWSVILTELDRIAKSGENEKWRQEVIDAAKNLREYGFDNSMRSEAWGRDSINLSKKKVWAVMLIPISWIANAPTAIQQYLINRRGDKIKALEFRSTLKVVSAMFIYPLSWTLIAILAGIYTPQFWMGFLGVWTWATFGNRFYGWLQGHLHDHRDALEGRRFWETEGSSDLRAAWTHYIKMIQKDIDA
ncbi:MAG: 1-acyl-sn-glycerol-3-phosphate acyltransferase [Flavobacteriales bacterium]|nr:1-acyl-sn-glycerol-3-phosphate acyltransferase [Flavobacteriales bacterium]